jgi:hypothetical protein
MPPVLEPAGSTSWPLPAPRPEQLRGRAGERELEPSGPGGEYTCHFQLVNALTCHTQDRWRAIQRFTKPPTASSIRTRLWRTAAEHRSRCRGARFESRHRHARDAMGDRFARTLTICVCADLTRDGWA